jgi:hypothetical protein
MKIERSRIFPESSSPAMLQMQSRLCKCSHFMKGSWSALPIDSICNPFTKLTQFCDELANLHCGLFVHFLQQRGCCCWHAE